MFRIHSLNVTRFALLCAALAFAGPSFVAADQDPCATAIFLDLNATLRGYGGDGETQVLRLDVPAAGIVSVDLSVPGSARAAPRLGLLDGHCSGSGMQPRAVLIEHAAARLSFASRKPGTYYLRAGAQDTRQALGDFKVRTAFVEAKTEVEVIDPDPGVLPDPQDPAPKTEVEVIDPDPGVLPDPQDPAPKTEVEVIDPDPKAFPAASPLFLASASLCRGIAVDDHGDTPRCATPLASGRRIQGEIDNDEADDVDVFVFAIAKLGTVSLATTGETDTYGTLFDHFGQRLDQVDDGGKDANFRLVRTLAPGLYFLHVEGSHQVEGSYRVTLEELEW